ncbi:MAG TPA: Type 1 glutamine amidotransferase-like domain-containing protein [Anaerolineales bacterium]|nr:Type 1 glutamine amidotransferase-like domain-containing protein [Anaerolineales bacterium]
MNGLIALVGSGEYLPVMNDIDRYLLDSLNLNGRKPRVVCLPTAAGQEGDGSINRWSNMGVNHFERLGAEISALRIIDKDSANDPQWESYLENADLIYFSGGDPGHLFQTMQGSLVWKAAQRAWERGAVYAGCSAGAMILADQIPRFRIPGTINGFGIVPAKFIVPHFDAIPAMFRALAFGLPKRLKEGQRMIGVDEDTALVGKLGGEWRVMGKSKVHIYTREGMMVYESGQSVILE